MGDRHLKIYEPRDNLRHEPWQGLQYPFGGVRFTTLGICYQQALRNYLTGPLGGVVTAASTRLAARAHHHRVTPNG